MKFKIKKRLYCSISIIGVILVCIMNVSAAADVTSGSLEYNGKPSSEAFERSESGKDISKLKLENVPQELALNSYLANAGDKKESKAKAAGIDPVDADSMETFTAVNDDGSKTAFVYSQPVKYVDKKTNEIKFIVNSFEKTGFLEGIFTDTAYTNKGNSFDIKLPKNIEKGVLFSENDYTIKMTPTVEKSEKPEEKEYEFMGEPQSVIEYPNAFGKGVHLQYAAINSGLKENVFMEEYIGINEFVFELELKGLRAELKEDMTIALSDEKTKDEVFFIEKPWAMDSIDGEVIEDEVHIEYDNEYNLEELEEGKYLLTMIIKKEFLENEKTVYPVLIDPTTITGRNNLQDCTVCKDGTNDRNNYLTIGKAGTSTESMAYVKMTNVGNFKYINPKNVSRKTVFFYTKQVDTTTTEQITIGLYDSNTTVNPINATYAGISSNVGYFEDQTTYSVNGVYPLWMGDMFAEWLKYELGEGGKSQNYGFILKATTTSSTYKRIASSRNAAADYEHVEINYTEDTTIATGTYFIRGVRDGKYLDHVTSDNRAIQYGFHGEVNQQWIVTKNPDGTYRISPKSNTIFGLEVYYSTDANGQPVTLYNYSSGASYQWRIIKNSDGTFRIMPAISKTRSIDVYYGANASYTYGPNGRVFYKQTGVDC